MSPDPKKSQSSDSLNSLSTDSALRKIPLPLHNRHDPDALYYADVEETRVSTLVSRKGYVNFLQDSKDKVSSVASVAKLQLKLHSRLFLLVLRHR